MITVYEMQYLHPVDEKTTIQMIPYSSRYQEEYKRIYNQCYHEMRKELDIKPFDFIQDDSFFESGMDKVFLLLCDGKIIGSVVLKGDEIDDLIVDIKNQNQGYGREVLEAMSRWCKAFPFGESDTLYTSCDAKNKSVISFYQSNGFALTGDYIDDEVVLRKPLGE